MRDDRIRCQDCAHLAYGGLCGAAAKGLRRDVGPQYHPVTDFPVACPHFKAYPRDPDQRPGAVRFPASWAGYVERFGTNQARAALATMTVDLANGSKRVRLSPADQAKAADLGAKRGKQDCRKMVGPDSVTGNIQGAAGEMAFARAFGLTIDESGELKACSFDAKTAAGYQVDVKATPHSLGRLICHIPDTGDRTLDHIDAFVLARLHRYPPDVVLVAWVWRDELKHPDNIRPLYEGGRPTYVLENDDPRLKTDWDLLTQVKPGRRAD